ncbi:hypothetical protein OHA72_57020 [Dactylosporangium sp. NBC_01737]|uniref:hypothetical protein n=1 Tax=Dactylosporangium sp. NBC_01737 TaxID=2975959 RepID=UPI002E0E3DD3|nr:hypothetical protein OHA72_57020 [Dactylosporangium sp. NBC_01737]
MVVGLMRATMEIVDHRAPGLDLRFWRIEMNNGTGSVCDRPGHRLDFESNVSARLFGLRHGGNVRRSNS